MFSAIANFFKSLFSSKSPLEPTQQVVVTPLVPPPPPKFFNEYTVKAAEWLLKNHANKGYSLSCAYSHEISYGPNGAFGVIKPTCGGKTMCVAAVQETIMEAMNIYARETFDTSVWGYLPFRSWTGFGEKDIHRSLWVDPKVDSFGTGDALHNFKMGERCKFSELVRGDFVGFNRKSGTGHAVMFVSFIDIQGNELKEYSASVVGFKYFSAQGPGLSYRYAFFSNVTPPVFTDGRKRDVGVIYSENRKILNCGKMWWPKRWGEIPPKEGIVAKTVSALQKPVHCDPKQFDGCTIDA